MSDKEGMEANDTDYINLYANSSEWADIKPIPSAEDPRLPFYIAYSEGYKDMMGYYRAVLDSHEMSKRALDVASRVIRSNPSNITAWWLRREIAEKLKLDKRSEMGFVNEMSKDCPKCYQIWYYRKYLVDTSDVFIEDLGSLADIISYDTKNFHAWSYTSWLAKRCKIVEQIFELTRQFILLDPSNNSAWVTRKSLLPNANLSMISEIDFAFSCLRKDLTNEPSCNYLRFISTTNANANEAIIQECEKFLSEFSDNLCCTALLFHCLRKKGDTSKREELCDKLAQLDPLAKKYWNYVKAGDRRFC